MIPHPRTQLWPDFEGMFMHDAVLRGCQPDEDKVAVIDTSLPPGHERRELQYGALATFIESLARGFVDDGLRPGEVVAIFLPNSWEFVVAVHAVTMAGLIPTLINPHYKQRELCHQLRDSGAAALITDGPQIHGINLSGLPDLRRVYVTRSEPQSGQQRLPGNGRGKLPEMSGNPKEILAALPYSSGTTGLPKGVMLTHANLVENVRQFLAPGEIGTDRVDDVIMCFLPLYHIYGLNVILNPTLMIGATLVLMPRFDVDQLARVVVEEGVTWLNVVPPAMNAIVNAAAEGRFPRAGEHRIRGAKSGAAPLAAELPRRLFELTGIPVRQGYGMTEASPVTHLGYLEAKLYRPESIGAAVAHTECRLLREDGSECEAGEVGELVIRGPQFMRGYWNAPEATAAALRDGWYHSGDIAVADERGFFKIVDRRKELIKYKGFPIAPAEVEAVLMEHPSVKDCGVVGCPDGECGEIPVAFVVPRTHKCEGLDRELPAYVAERLISYKQPRAVRFVESIPRNPSGKILRKDLRAQL